MLIKKDVCIGCRRCLPYCPAGAIRFNKKISEMDQDRCYECGTCLRSQICPVDAIKESPFVFDFPRSVRKAFSDPIVTHVQTGVAGRGTEESKTNDVTGRIKKGEVGIGIEVGRPTVGIRIADIEVITRALATTGVVEYEPQNPTTYFIKDFKTGAIKEEYRDERILSGILEMKIDRKNLPILLRAIKGIIPKFKGIFSLNVMTRLEPDTKIPILDILQKEGFPPRPHAKINLGLGRPLKED